MFTTIETARLTKVSGGGMLGDAAYKFGYGAGGAVTRLYEKLPSGARMVTDPSNPSRQIPNADIPVIGPALTNLGFTHIGAGATDVVNDRANLNAR
jgi:hypothetical protein